MKNSILRIVLIAVGAVIGLVVVLVLGAFVTLRLLNRTNGAIVSAGEERRYLLYVPDSYDPAVPAPLVITIHGLVQWPAHQEGLSGWNELADREGFLVVYPAGTGFPLRWRANGPDAEPDIAFLTDLIDTLSAEYAIDPARIYANGLSNGAGMSFVLGCALSERIAALGLVGGAYTCPWEACDPERPVPAIVFHGTDDPVVPFAGGRSGPLDAPFPVIDEWVDEMARHNGCDPDPETLPASGVVRGVRYSDCAADVVYYTVEGGGHTWPGGGYLPYWLAGHITQDIDATEEMWRFFQEHPLPE